MMSDVLVETTLLAPNVADAVPMVVAVFILFANCSIPDSAIALPKESKCTILKSVFTFLFTGFLKLFTNLREISAVPVKDE